MSRLVKKGEYEEKVRYMDCIPKDRGKYSRTLDIDFGEVERTNVQGELIASRELRVERNLSESVSEYSVWDLVLGKYAEEITDDDRGDELVRVEDFDTESIQREDLRRRMGREVVTPYEIVEEWENPNIPQTKIYEKIYPEKKLVSMD
ncbi:MAG: hypothetical protein ABEJ72_03795 [Candidatus Aenigmatarchaeota archaeon]